MPTPLSAFRCVLESEAESGEQPPLPRSAVCSAAPRSSHQESFQQRSTRHGAAISENIDPEIQSSATVQFAIFCNLERLNTVALLIRSLLTAMYVTIVQTVSPDLYPFLSTNGEECNLNSI